MRGIGDLRVFHLGPLISYTLTNRRVTKQLPVHLYPTSNIYTVCTSLQALPFKPISLGADCFLQLKSDYPS